jgi:hypothetical protein
MIPSNLNRCRFEILENNKQTRESTALSVAYNVERWRRGWEGIVGRRRRVATWTYPYTAHEARQKIEELQDTVVEMRTMISELDAERSDMRTMISDLDAALMSRCQDLRLQAGYQPGARIRPSPFQGLGSKTKPLTLTPTLSSRCTCVFITTGPSTKLFAWGGGGYGRTCATRDDEPRPVWTRLPITH